MAKKAPTLKDVDRRLLAEACDALATNGAAMATDTSLKALLSYPADHGGPLVEVNPTMKEGDKIAFRATANGVAVAKTLGIGPAEQPNPGNAGASDTNSPAGASGAATGATDTGSAGASEFTLETGIAIPPIKRGGRAGTGTKYPFDQMAPQQSFFIAKTADNPKPAKRIASVVSNWNKKEQDKPANERRKWRCQAVTDPKLGEGARVWRIA